jgi:parallel beta-helix repeat protein
MKKVQIIKINGILLGLIMILITFQPFFSYSVQADTQKELSNVTENLSNLDSKISDISNQDSIDNPTVSDYLNTNQMEGLLENLACSIQSTSDLDSEQKLTDQVRGPDLHLYKLYYNPFTRQWVHILDLTMLSLSVVHVAIVIRNEAICECIGGPSDCHAGCTWAPTTFSVFDNILNNSGGTMTTAWAHIYWPTGVDACGQHTPSGDVDVSDQAQLISRGLKFYYIEGSAWAGNYQLPQHNQQEIISYPITLDPIVTGNRFSWMLQINPHFQPQSELYIMYDISVIQQPYFIHVTDIHWGQGEQQNSYWYLFLNSIRSRPNPPKFVLCTGDIVDYAGDDAVGGGGASPFMSFVATIYGSPGDWYIDSERSIPLLFCPGNHDQYVRWFEGIWRIGILGFPDFWYYQYFIDPNLCYTRSIGNYQIISLNSCPDHLPYIPFIGSPLSPEGDGLDDASISELDNLGQSTHNIIMLHHPYLNPRGWDLMDGVFLNNRDNFASQCIYYNDRIDMILGGHTHMPFTCTLWGIPYYDSGSLGENFQYRKIYLPDFYRDSESPPIAGDVETLASTLNVNVVGNVRVDAYDEGNNHTGIEGDQIVNRISGSSFRFIGPNDFDGDGNNEIPTMISIIKNENKNYRFVIHGRMTEMLNISVTFNLQSDGASTPEGKHIIAYYNNTQFYVGSIATIYANHSWPDYILKIQDINGNRRNILPTGFEGNDLVLINAPPYSGPNPQFNGHSLCYSTIQEGIDVINEYGTVYVYPGTYNYHQGLQITKPLRLCGANKETTVLNCGNSGNSRLNLSSSDVTICDFTINGAINSGFMYTEGQSPGYTGITISGNIIDVITFDHLNSNVISQNTINGMVNICTSRKTLITDNIFSYAQLLIDYNSLYNTISDNLFYYSDITMDTESSRNLISDNIFTSLSEYHYIEIASYSKLNIVQHNNLEGYSIIIGGRSENNTIKDNIITDTYQQNTGIVLLSWSNNNTISRNTISNFMYGIRLQSCRDNVITHNNLLGNTYNAFDTGINTWYDTINHTGNYWSDYLSRYPVAHESTQYPGTWDTPYTINGRTPPNQDLYPFIDQNSWVLPLSTPITTGFRAGFQNIDYVFKTSAIDPNGDSIQYGWDWNGDGIVDEWTVFSSSGLEVFAIHHWSDLGSYEVAVKARNIHGKESVWSTPLRFNIMRYGNIDDDCRTQLQDSDLLETHRDNGNLNPIRGNGGDVGIPRR